MTRLSGRACAVLACAWMVAGCSAPEADFRVSLAEGDTLTYNVTDYTSFNASGRPPVRAESLVEIALDLEVLSVEPGGPAEIKATFQNANVEALMGSLALVVSMDDLFDGIDPARQFGELLKGQSFEFTLQPTGRISSIRGMEAVRDAVKRGMKFDGAIGGLQIPKPVQRQLAETYVEYAGTESIRTLLEANTKIVPPEPVAVGESWTGETYEYGMLEMKRTVTYTVTEITEDTVTLSFTSESSHTDLDKNVALSGTEEGTLVVDLETGLVSEMRNAGELTGSATVGGSSRSLTFTVTGHAGFK